MSLFNELYDWFGKAHFDWRTGATYIPPFSSASVDTRIFIWPCGQPHPYISYDDEEALRNRLRTERKTQAQWLALDDVTKAEILALLTVRHHEDTHRVDMLATPFGVAIATAGLALYTHLDEIAVDLAAAPDEVLERPLLESPFVPPALAKRVARLLSLKRRAQRFTQPGWSVSEGSVTIWGHTYPTLRVLDEFETLKTNDRPFNYLSSSALLECRALAHALRRIRLCFAYDTRVAGAEMARYLRLFYQDREQWHDYRFLLDQAARGAGVEDIECLLQTLAQRGATSTQLEQFITVFSSLCWAALHGADPVVRLCAALHYVESEIASANRPGPRWRDPGEMLDDYEEWLLSNGQASVYSNLAVCRASLEAAEGTVAGISHAVMREHFERVIGTLRFQIEHRIAKGGTFRSPIGMTVDGTPLFNNAVRPKEFTSIITMLTGPELDDLMVDESKPIVSPTPSKTITDWYDGVEQMLLYPAINVQDRRDWLSLHYELTT